MVGAPFMIENYEAFNDPELFHYSRLLADLL